MSKPEPQGDKPHDSDRDDAPTTDGPADIEIGETATLVYERRSERHEREVIRERLSGFGTEFVDADLDGGEITMRDRIAVSRSGVVEMANRGVTLGTLVEVRR